MLSTSADPQVSPGLLANAIGLAGLHRDQGRLHLHAACVAREGRGLVLVAPSGGGKSTLAAGLVRRGWSYLSDEAVAILPGSRTVFGFPRPIALKGDAPRLLGIEDLESADDPDGRHLYRASTLGELAAVCRPTRLAFPRLVSGRSRVRPVTTDEAMHLLLADCLDASRLGPATVDVLATLVATTTVVGVDVGELESALDLLDAIEEPESWRSTATAAVPDGLETVVDGIRCTIDAGMHLRTEQVDHCPRTEIPAIGLPRGSSRVLHGPALDRIDGRPIHSNPEGASGDFTGLGPKVLHPWIDWSPVLERATPVMVAETPEPALHPVDRLLDTLLCAGMGETYHWRSEAGARMLWNEQALHTVIDAATSLGLAAVAQAGVRALRRDLGQGALPVTLDDWERYVEPALSAMWLGWALRLAWRCGNTARLLRWPVTVAARAALALASTRASRPRHRQVRWRSILPIPGISSSPPRPDTPALPPGYAP